MAELPARPILEPGSLTLVERAKAGDTDAVNQLIARYLPKLRRWAHGRVPASARHAEDTEDLVQETVISLLRNLDAFEYRREGALQAYLRQSLLNRIRGKFRQANRRPAGQSLSMSMPAALPSPLDEAIGAQMVETYEAALHALTADDRELVIAKIEMGYTNEELAFAFDKPSPDAARVAVGRALLKLAAAMKHE